MQSLNTNEKQETEFQEEMEFFGVSDDIFEQEETRDEEQTQLNREKYKEKFDNVIRTKDLTEQEKNAKHQEYVKQRRKRERERRKLNKKLKKATGVKPETTSKLSWQEKKDIKEKLKQFKDSTTRIVIDLSFSHTLLDKELKSLVLQLTFCYNALKKSNFPISYNLCSFNGDVEAEGLKMGMDNWDINLHHQGINKVFTDKLDTVVYLSPDAEKFIYEFKEDHTYVIGGIVDKVINKNESKQRAQEIKVVSRKLPLHLAGLSDKFRSSLNVNTVFEIIVEYFNCKDIAKAIQKCIPQKYIINK